MSEDYKTKSNIAWDIVQRLIASFNIARILADAHYATKALLRKLIESGILFLMKMPRNRKVIIRGKHDQLQRLLRLKRNEHVRYAIGFYDNIRYFFYVVKVGQGKTVYLISSDFIRASSFGTATFFLAKPTWLYLRLGRDFFSFASSLLSSITFS